MKILDINRISLDAETEVYTVWVAGAERAEAVRIDPKAIGLAAQTQAFCEYAVYLKTKTSNDIKQAVQELFDEIELIDSPYLSSHDKKLSALKKLVEMKE